MLDKEFLEEYPLFKKFKTTVPEFLREIKTPPINMFCKNCGNVHTFLISKQQNDLASLYDISSGDKIFHLEYRCASCHFSSREFHIFISPKLDYIYKYGQYPEWEIKIDKNLEKSLGKHAQLFKKGLVCESQGYGIGAFSYYRRITEVIIDELLDSISDLIEPENIEKYKKALENTKKTTVTQEKIELVKDLLPSILRPKNMNPLNILHSELSIGLHSETDDICLEKATHIKDILTFLINQIIQSKESSMKFTEGMKTLLDNKSKQK